MSEKLYQYICVHILFTELHIKLLLENSHIQIKFQVFYLPILNEDTIK